MIEATINFLCWSIVVVPAGYIVVNKFLRAWVRS